MSEQTNPKPLNEKQRLALIQRIATKTTELQGLTKQLADGCPAPTEAPARAKKAMENANAPATEAVTAGA